MKKTKLLLISLLIFSTLFLPISPSNFFVFSQEVDEIFDYVEINEDFEVDGDLFIPEETTVVVKKGVKISMNGSIFIEGKLIVKGTIEDPVEIIKAEGGGSYSIEIWEGGKIGNDECGRIWWWFKCSDIR